MTQTERLCRRKLYLLFNCGLAIVIPLAVYQQGLKLIAAESRGH